MDYRFCCFGDWDDMEPRCLLKCHDRWSCKRETQAIQLMEALKKEVEELQREREAEVCTDVPG